MATETLAPCCGSRIADPWWSQVARTRLRRRSGAKRGRRSARRAVVSCDDAASRRRCAVRRLRPGEAPELRGVGRARPAQRRPGRELARTGTLPTLPSWPHCELAAAAVALARTLDRTKLHAVDLLLVGIELRGLMRSSYAGVSWQDHRPGVQPDVHSPAWHPHTAGRAYEAGCGGAAFSTDGGESWQPPTRAATANTPGP
jgi:hypothetical protein